MQRVNFKSRQFKAPVDRPRRKKAIDLMCNIVEAYVYQLRPVKMKIEVMLINLMVVLGSDLF